MKVVGVIPARYASTRLPGKPLQDILGKPMIRRVYESAARSRLLEMLIVATDDERILEAVRAFGGRAVLTSRDHATGTDRVAEVVRGLEAEIVVNIQGGRALRAPGDDRRDRGASPAGPPAAHVHLHSRDPRPRGLRQSQRDQGDGEPGRRRPVLLAFPVPVSPQSRGTPGVRAHRAVRLPPGLTVEIRGPAPDPAGEAGVPGATTRAGARLPATRSGDPPALHPAERGHPRGSGAGARAGSRAGCGGSVA